MHNIAFQIGSFTIYWYGILTAIGFMVGFWLASRRAPHDGISPEAITGLAPWIIGGAILGARTLYVITHWKEDFSGQPFWEIFRIRSGLVFYGGLIGASLGTIVYVRRQKLPLWKVADVLAPSIALGHAFGRIGCLMTGCCHGKPCNLPWAIYFPKEHDTKGGWVHPTQIYEAGLNLLLFFALARFFPRKRFDGQVFALYLIAYAILRSVVEIFRGDYPSRYLGLFTPAQLVSVGILAAGCALFWLLPRNAGAPGSKQKTF